MLEHRLARPPLACIDENTCIGCTLCIAACPVDAIVGAAKLMHTVLADRCTGCELCVPACPVDCIALVPRERPWTRDDAARAMSHEQARTARLALQAARRPHAARTRFSEETLRSQRRAAVAAALARARARRAARRRNDPYA